MIPKRRNRRRSKQIVKPELRTIVETPVATMADTRTMSELLQAPTEGYRDAIVLPPILAKNFELKVGLLTLVTSSQFHGFERDDPHSHIRWFNKITSTLKYKNVPHDAIKLMIFPFSLEGAARIWLPPLVLSIHGKISFLTAGGNLLNRTPRDDLTIIENKSKVRTSRNKPVVSKMSATTSSSTPAYLPEITALTDTVKAMLLQNKTPSPAHVKAMEETYVICGGHHPYYEPTIPTTSSPLSKEVEREPEATKDKVQNTSSGSTTHIQPSVVQVPILEPDVAPKPSIPYPSRLNDQKLREKANNQMLKFL
ncbi:hypothetical protein Tco_1441761 [Tanacetum coccineum]